MKKSTRDIRLVAEAANFAVDNKKRMIANGRMEDPPQPPKRKELTRI
ncbi:hypothetical protein [Paenibacillus humicola]|nr:hypothetical protein [Paenibacillus humicola]